MSIGTKPLGSQSIGSINVSSDTKATSSTRVAELKNTDQFNKINEYGRNGNTINDDGRSENSVKDLNNLG